MYKSVGDLTWTSATSGLATKMGAAGRGRWNSVPLPSSSTTGGPVGRMLTGAPLMTGGVCVAPDDAEGLSTSAALAATHSINPEAAAATVRRLRIYDPSPGCVDADVPPVPPPRNIVMTDASQAPCALDTLGNIRPT